MKKETITIWRVERDREGPFQIIVGGSLRKMLLRRFGSKKHYIHQRCTIDTDEAEEKFGVHYTGIYFAFDSEQQMIDYFGVRILKALTVRGFEIKTYQVREKDIIRGQGEIAVLGVAIYPDLEPRGIKKHRLTASIIIDDLAKDDSEIGKIADKWKARLDKRFIETFYQVRKSQSFIGVKTV